MNQHRKIKYYFFGILFSAVFSTFKVQGQEDTLFHFIKKIDYPISSVTVDQLGELYIIDNNNQLKKYDQQGDSVAVFNQVTKFGKLSYVEAQNPWKTILFYENFATIVLLDKYLNYLTNINLPQQNIFQVK